MRHAAMMVRTLGKKSQHQYTYVKSATQTTRSQNFKMITFRVWASWHNSPESERLYHEFAFKPWNNNYLYLFKN